MMNTLSFNYLRDFNLYKSIVFLSLNTILSFSVLAVGVPSTPSSPSASANGNNISVYWGSSSNATYYDLSIKYNTNGWTPPGRYTFTGTNTSWSGLGQGTRSYKVRACNNSGCSGYSGSSSGVVIYPIPSTPRSPSASVNGDNISVYWGASSNATYYDLSIKYNTNSWTPPGRYTFTGTSTSWSGLGQGTRSYKVRACNSTGCSGYSGSSSGVVIYPIPSTPTSPSASVNDDNVSVHWGSSSNATYYDLSIKYNTNSWTSPGKYTFSGTSASWSGLDQGTRSYKVRACNSTGCSGYSGSSSGVVIYPILKAPENFNATVKDKNISVTWSEMQGAEKYDVLIKYNANDWTAPGKHTTQNNSISWNNLPSGTRSYKVRSCDNNLSTCSVWSEASNTVSISVWPTAVVNDKDIKVTWGAIQGAEKYDVLIKYNDNDWTAPGKYTTQNNSISWNNLPSGTRSYKVRSCDNNLSTCSVWSEASNTVSISVWPIAVVNGKDINVTWGAIQGAEKYDVLIKYNDNDWTAPGRYTTHDNSISWNNLPSGTRSYKVRSCDSNLSTCSAWSEASNSVSISVWPTAVVDGKDIKVTWGEIQGAEKYDVLIKYNDNDWTAPGKYTTLDNRISWNNLPSGTRSYKVRSCDSNLLTCSAWSEPSNFVLISSPEVYRDNIGSLFLKLSQPHGYQYLKLSKNLDNNWIVIELEESLWNKLELTNESFSIEIADFNFDNSPDFKLTSANKNIVITGLKTNTGYQVNQTIKINIAIDILGKPVTN
jgi:phosphatidylethanolamine-binding protein (PEBP) family uncharacterized protein